MRLIPPSETDEGQVMVLPTLEAMDLSTAAPTQKEGSSGSNDTEDTTVELGTQAQAVTQAQGPVETQTQGAQPSREDGPDKPPQVRYGGWFYRFIGMWTSSRRWFYLRTTPSLRSRDNCFALFCTYITF